MKQVREKKAFCVSIAFAFQRKAESRSSRTACENEMNNKSEYSNYVSAGNDKLLTSRWKRNRAESDRGEATFSGACESFFFSALEISSAPDAILIVELSRAIIIKRQMGK